VRLRSTPTDLTEAGAKAIFKQRNFLASDWNQQGRFANNFIDNGDDTVTDRATGLMWQWSSSSKYVNYADAKAYVGGLNLQGFAGHSDWRLPTLEEGARCWIRLGATVCISPRSSILNRGGYGPRTSKVPVPCGASLSTSATSSGSPGAAPTIFVSVAPLDHESFGYLHDLIIFFLVTPAPRCNASVGTLRRVCVRSRANNDVVGIAHLICGFAAGGWHRRGW
jgi:hypothetical protein